MDWSKGYKRESKASWDDIAQAIHDSVTMDEVLSVYAPGVPRRHGRCPCPLHDGKDYNFSYSKLGYKCFVCGASGDVIAFVKDKLGLATRADAMKRINADLHLNLPLDSTLSSAESAEIDRRRAEAQRRKEERDAWWSLYHRLMDRWIECDKTKREADPTSDEYAEACKSIDYIAHQLDCLPAEPR